MADTVFKRCTKCGNYVKQRSCSKCGATGFKWAFRIYVGKDTNGRWVRQLRSGFQTKKQAERALRDVQSSLDQGTYVKASHTTLGQFLQSEWLPTTRPPAVKVRDVEGPQAQS